MKLLIPPPVQGLIAGIVIWGIGRWVPDFSIFFPDQKLIAVTIAGVGVTIDLISIFAFFRAKTTVSPLAPQKTNALVVSGLYKISRNPMYLGILFILIGWAIWIGNPVAIIPIAIFMVSLNILQIKPEEEALEKKFGQSYRDYKKRVRRWV